jgi:putative Holliday junction resolvase
MITEDIHEFASVLKSGYSMLCIDYGQRKCGIALSSPEKHSSIPFIIYKTPEIIEKIVKLSQIYRIDSIILGLPINMNGTRGDQVDKVIKFASYISKLGYPIYLQDERMTSKMASSLVGSKKTDEDAIAASIILNAVLIKLRTVIASEYAILGW